MIDGTYIHDDVIEAAIETVKRMTVAAENSNHAGEVAILRAAAATDLARALQAILPYCTEAPADIKKQAADAIAKSRGDTRAVYPRRVA